jgi:hypothetical protein
MFSRAAIEQSVKTPHGCGPVSEKESALVALLEIGAHRDTSLFDRIM